VGKKVPASGSGRLIGDHGKDGGDSTVSQNTGTARNGNKKCRKKTTRRKAKEERACRVNASPSGGGEKGTYPPPRAGAAQKGAEEGTREMPL